MTTQDSSRRSPSYFRLIQRAVHPAYTRLMLRRAAAAIWNEPPPRRPAAILWWDVAIPAVAIPLGVWEALAADAAPWRPVAVVLAILLPWPMVIRRRRPLVAFIAGFTPSLLVDVVAIAAEVPWKAGASGIFVLLLAYSLFRWGAGRDAVIGVLLLAVVVAISTLKGEIHTAPEAIAAVVVLLFGPTLGVALRFRASAHRQALDHARLRERAQLARELHDTVAHHVSAIALQAQAGRAVAATRPAAALATLAVIEQAASRTLSELRTIVGALRTDRDAERAPQRGIQDLDALGIAAGPNVAVQVCLRGDLEDLAPSIEAAIYRLVQESVTNAARHAVGASRVDVEVAGGAEEIRVVVADNGAPVSRPAEGPGFGLVGMQERAALLGGTFTAGPRAERGWQVEAVLPRRGFGP